MFTIELHLNRKPTDEEFLRFVTAMKAWLEYEYRLHPKNSLINYETAPKTAPLEDDFREWEQELSS
ncbi:MAG: hypothetical protein ACREQA_17205 [Candidatus Binatia bacterium]